MQVCWRSSTKDVAYGARITVLSLVFQFGSRCMVLGMISNQRDQFFVQEKSYARKCTTSTVFITVRSFLLCGIMGCVSCYGCGEVVPLRHCLQPEPSARVGVALQQESGRQIVSSSRPGFVSRYHVPFLDRPPLRQGSVRPFPLCRWVDSSWQPGVALNSVESEEVFATKDSDPSATVSSSNSSDITPIFLLPHEPGAACHGSPRFLDQSTCVRLSVGVSVGLDRAEQVDRNAIATQEHEGWLGQILAQASSSCIAIKRIIRKRQFMGRRLQFSEQARRFALEGDEQTFRQLLVAHWYQDLRDLKVRIATPAVAGVRRATSSRLFQQRRAVSVPRRVASAPLPARQWAREHGLLPEELAFFEAQLHVAVRKQSHDAIKKAYRTFCLYYHPSKNVVFSADEGARRTKMFMRIKEVYDRLNAQERERQQVECLRMTRMASTSPLRSVSARPSGRHGTAGRPPFRT